MEPGTRFAYRCSARLPAFSSSPGVWGPDPVAAVDGGVSLSLSSSATAAGGGWIRAWQGGAARDGGGDLEASRSPAAAVLPTPFLCGGLSCSPYQRRLPPSSSLRARGRWLEEGSATCPRGGGSGWPYISWEWRTRGRPGEQRSRRHTPVQRLHPLSPYWRIGCADSLSSSIHQAALLAQVRAIE